MGSPFRGTTICAVRRNGETAIAGDGQVTMGENTIFKTSTVFFSCLIFFLVV